MNLVVSHYLPPKHHLVAFSVEANSEVQLLEFKTVPLLTNCDFGQVLNLSVPLCPYLSRDNIYY